MGVKGLYGYCLKNVSTCNQMVDIVEEIGKCKDEKEKPKIMINLHTLSYHFKVKKKDLICGYQLNKIKYEVEKFFQNLIDAGAELIFVFQKPSPEDEEFIKRRLNDYKNAYQLIKKIEKVQVFEKLMNDRLCAKIPFNIHITLCMCQSARKFGKVYGFNSVNVPAAIASAQLATKENCKWILGLSTFKFFVPGNWKVWSDEKLDMDDMKVLEIDKDPIMQHFGINYEHSALFMVLAGFLQTDANIKKKVVNHFGSVSKMQSIGKFVRDLKYPLTDETYVDIAKKIFGQKYEQKFIDDLKASVERYSIEPKEVTNTEYDDEIMDLIQNDFLSYAEAILLNKMQIFTSPVFLDLDSPDMENFNLLILPWIQKTAGILLKNSSDKEPRDIYILADHKGKFERIKLDIIYPHFEVPPLKALMTGELSTFDKMKILFWLMDFELSDIEIPCMEEEYTVDCMILLYLVKKNSLTVLDARCILKTLVDARSQAIPLEYSTEYPKKVNNRALRCTYLYSKMYFILHSCLACFGMKNFCPELKFDGVYFQKMYALNVLNELDEGDDEENVHAGTANIANTRESQENNNQEKHETPIIPNDKDVDQTELVEMFAKIIRIND